MFNFIIILRENYVSLNRKPFDLICKDFTMQFFAQKKIFLRNFPNLLKNLLPNFWRPLRIILKSHEARTSNHCSPCTPDTTAADVESWRRSSLPQWSAVGECRWWMLRGKWTRHGFVAGAWASRRYNPGWHFWLKEPGYIKKLPMGIIADQLINFMRRYSKSISHYR
jgi:hypothetical protein